MVEDFYDPLNFEESQPTASLNDYEEGDSIRTEEEKERPLDPKAIS